MRSINFYKKLIKRIGAAVSAARIPRSFSKKKNNVFSNKQHVAMQVLMQIECKKFRDMPAFLELIYRELKLPKIPHFTTINKFALRCKLVLVEQLIAQLVKTNQETLVAIDGTGFSLNARSPYFCTIAGERNQFMQCVAAADVKRRLFTAIRLRRKRRNENVDVSYLMKASAEQMPILVFLGDKGFDSEKNHVLAEKYGAKFIAPLRKTSKKVYKTTGIHRKKLLKEFPSDIYHKRSVIEGLFSAVKRRFGHQIRARKFAAQKNELMFRILAYNFERLVNALTRLLSTEPKKK